MNTILLSFLVIIANQRLAFAQNAAAPVLWMEAQWYADDNCQGSPVSLYLFTTATPLNWTLPTGTGENWPEMYYFNGGNYPYYPCGLLESPISDLCCTSSLDTSYPMGTYGVASASDYVISTSSSDTLLSDGQINYWAPTGADLVSYCYLSILSSNALSPLQPTYDLYGFQSILYKSDDYSCIDPYTYPTTCFENGTIAFYTGQGCTGNVSTTALNSTGWTPISNNLVGNVEGKVITITNAKQTIGWTTYTPWVLFIPTYKNKFEILSLALLIVSLIGLTACFGWSVYRMYNHRVFQMYFLAFVSFLWMFHVIFAMVYYNTIFLTPQAALPTQVLYYYSLGFSILGTMARTEFFTHSIVKTSLWIRVASYIFIICSWFGLIGGVLLSVNPVFNNASWMTPWLYKEQYIFLVMFIWDIIPFVILLLYILQIRGKLDKTQILKSIQLAYYHDLPYTRALEVQILLVIGVYLVSFLAKSTSVMQNDRTVQAVEEGFLPFFEALHFLLNAFMSERIAELFRKKTADAISTIPMNTESVYPSPKKSVDINPKNVSSATEGHE